MNCENCKNKLLCSDYNRFCIKCISDKKIMITKFDAKRTYNLSEDDFELSDSHNVYYVPSGSASSYDRYLITDLEKFIEEVSKCSTRDKRYKAMIMIRKARLEEQNKQRFKDENKQAIKELLKSMIVKTDRPELLNEMKYLIDNDYYLDLDVFLTTDVNMTIICDRILPLLEKKADSLKKIYLTLSTRYNKKYENYMELLKPDSYNCKYCIEHIDQRTDVVGCLIYELEHEMNIREQNRRAKIVDTQIHDILNKSNNNLLDDEDFYKFVKEDKMYQNYVYRGRFTNNTNGTKNTKNTSIYQNHLFKQIVENAIEKIKKRDRKNTIDAEITKHESFFDVRTLDEYKEYVENNKGTFDEVMNKIFETVKKYGLKRNDGLDDHAVDLIRKGINVTEIYDRVDKFATSNEDQIIINDYCALQLYFLNMVCKKRTYIYNRVNKSTVTIKKH